MSREAAYRKTVGNAIRRQRLALGQNQTDVAVGIGASAASISSWEAGKSTLSAYWHAQLSAYFKVEFSKLENKKISNVASPQVQA